MNTSSKQPQEASDVVSVDYFLYSCFEYEKTFKSRPKKTNENRWPLACSNDKESNPEVTNHTIEELIDLLCKWYQKSYPQLADETLDLDNLADVVPAFMLLMRDMDIIVKAKTNEYLPSYEPESQSSIWVAVSKAIQDSFKLSDMYLKYLHWSNAAQPQSLEEDLGARPPVGRFAPGFRRSPNFQSDRTKGKNDRDKARPRKKSQYGKDKPKGPRQPDSKRNAELERETLKAVLKSVQKLNENDDLNEIALPPANSFYRRLQHKQIENEGLFSKSAGEGAERHVVILRTKSEN